MEFTVSHISAQEEVESIIKSAVAQRDSILLREVQNLVEVGILEISKDEPVMVRDPRAAEPWQGISIQQRVSLVFTGQHELDKLKRENKDLKDAFKQLKHILQNGKAERGYAYWREDECD